MTTRPVLRFQCPQCDRSVVTHDARKVYCSDRCRVAAHRQRIEDSGLSCAYCGEPADTRDHVFPRCRREDFPNWRETHGHLPDTVPACRQCNSIAHHHIHESVAERREFVQFRLEIKYRADLAFPDWTEDEVALMNGHLHRDIERGIARRERAKRRISYPGDPRYEH